MEFAPSLAGAIALQALDLAAKAHDFGLNRGQRERLARLPKGKQSCEPLGFSQGTRGLGEPLILVWFTWTHRRTSLPKGRADSAMK